MAARTIVIRRFRCNLPPERVFRDRRNPLYWTDEDELLIISFPLSGITDDYGRVGRRYGI